MERPKQANKSNKFLANNKLTIEVIEPVNKTYSTTSVITRIIPIIQYQSQAVPWILFRFFICLFKINLYPTKSKKQIPKILRHMMTDYI